MSLRDLLKNKLGGLMGQAQPLADRESSPGDYKTLLDITPADEMSYLRHQITAHRDLVNHFDAELRESISRLHEPALGERISPDQVSQIKAFKQRCDVVMAMSGLAPGQKHPEKTPYALYSAIETLELAQIKGETLQRLQGLKELQDVLDSFDFEPLEGEPLKLESFRQSLIKLILTNLYGKAALVELYPENRKTLAQIREEFKNTNRWGV